MKEDPLLPRHQPHCLIEQFGHKSPLAGTINDRYSDSPMPMAPKTNVVIAIAVCALWTGCGVDRTSGSEGSQPGQCMDSLDNDGDGAVDCLDPDCAGAPDCAEDTNDTDDDDGGDDDTADDDSGDDDDGADDDDDDDGADSDDGDDDTFGDDDGADDDDDSSSSSGPCIDMPCCCEPDPGTGEPTCQTCVEQLAPPPLGCGADPSGWTPNGHLQEEGNSPCCGWDGMSVCDECEDGIDNDNDNIVDCEDEGCWDWCSGFGDDDFAGDDDFPGDDNFPGDDDSSQGWEPCVDIPCCCEPDPVTDQPTCETCVEQLAPPPLGCGIDPASWTPEGDLLEEGNSPCCGWDGPANCNECQDGIDNDNDGALDCNDDGCSSWCGSFAGGSP